MAKGGRRAGRGEGNKAESECGVGALGRGRWDGWRKERDVDLNYYL